MSTAAVDTARTSERLSAYLSEIHSNEPVDNIFVRLALLDFLLKKRDVGNHGRQVLIPLDTAQNGSVQEFSDTDAFDVSIPDTARSAVYAMVNYGGSLAFSWEEMRETASDDVRVFDLVSHRRRNVMKALRDLINGHMFASSVASKRINSLPVIASTSRSLGGINSASNSYWDAQETTSVGAFASSGLSSMRTLYNNILQANGEAPELIVTTQSVMEAFENEIDVDVRYAKSDVLSRGAEELHFRSARIVFDDDCPTGHLYMVNSKNLEFYVDSAGDFQFGDVKESFSQAVFAAKLMFRGQLLSAAPRGLGRLTGIT